MNPYCTSEHLLTGFSRSVVDYPKRAALQISTTHYTYEELSIFADRIASGILQNVSDDDDAIGILASRSLAAYGSILGVLRAGRTYVPLNPKFPLERTARMVQAAGLSHLIVEEAFYSLISPLLSLIEQPFTIFCDQHSPNLSLPASATSKIIPIPRAGSARVPSVPSKISTESPAYLLFTSGSTGIPKGVPVSHRNVLSYLAYISDRYSITPSDRFSQTFDLTFDLSVHDMFLCWGSGACLCPLPERVTMAPAKFIRDMEITMWFSVPSVITFMQRMRLLRPQSFPSLRYSLFCGEPLMLSSAEAWQTAATNSVVENLYGPTEATIAITHFRFDASCPQSVPNSNGIVPIGTPFPGQRCKLVNEQLQSVADSQSGELCLAGSQVTSGYLNDKEKTALQFVKLEGEGEVLWYRTGDLVQKDSTGCYHYRGRIDNQVQVRGHRVELQEIENVLRSIADESAIAVAWPPHSANVESLIAVCFQSEPLDEERILDHCRRLLPKYMVPERVFRLSAVPLNANGKVDRIQITDAIQELLK